MTPYELVLKHFPKASEQDIEMILYEKTGFPCFFKDVNQLEEQIALYKEAVDQGKDVCFGCGKIVDELDLGMCPKCEKVVKLKEEVE